MEELRKKVNELIRKYEQESDKIKLQKLYIISRILENDRCFFEMKVQEALNILTDLEIEDCKEKYKELVSIDNWRPKNT